MISLVKNFLHRQRLFIAGITLSVLGPVASASPMILMLQGQQLILGQSPENPAVSCIAIVNAGAARASGVYWLTTGSTPYQAYCDMTPASAGWTLVMRMANDTTLTYDSAYWTNTTVFDNDTTNSLTPGLNQNAKFTSFVYAAGTQIRGCKGDHTGSCLYMNLASSVTPLTLFSGAAQSGAGNLSRANLEAIFGTVASEPNCNMTGTNQSIGSIFGRVRFGVLVNGEADCNSPDSELGWGGKISNSVSCGAGNGDWVSASNTCYQGSLWIK